MGQEDCSCYLRICNEKKLSLLSLIAIVQPTGMMQRAAHRIFWGLETCQPLWILGTGTYSTLKKTLSFKQNWKLVKQCENPRLPNTHTSTKMLSGKLFTQTSSTVTPSPRWAAHNKQWRPTVIVGVVMPRTWQLEEAASEEDAHRIPSQRLVKPFPGLSACRTERRKEKVLYQGCQSWAPQFFTKFNRNFTTDLSQLVWMLPQLKPFITSPTPNYTQASLC